MPRLTESLIKKLEPDIRRGLSDAELQEKHDIPKSTWGDWRKKCQEDRRKGLETLRTILFDMVQEGREEFSKQIENVFVKVALGEWMYVTTRTYKDKSGEIIKTVEKITTKSDFKVTKFLLNYLAPKLFGKNKKTETPSTGARVPNPDNPVPAEWLPDPKQTNPTQPKEAEKQPKQRERVVNPIEWSVIEMALGIGKSVSIKKVTNQSGEIIQTVERTTTRKPNLKAAKFWLNHRDPEFWNRYKNPESTSIGAIVPDPGPPMTDEEWEDEFAIPYLKRMGIRYNCAQNTQKSPRNSPKEAEKQPEQKEKDEAE